MQIKLLKLGHSTQVLDIPAGSTIADVLSEADVSSEGYSIALDGLGATLTTVITQPNMALCLTPKIEGGLG